MPVVLRTPWFYSAGLLLLALLFVYAGWRDVRRYGEIRATAVVLWLLALLALAAKLPSYLLDEIRLEHDRMRWTVGPWWDRAEGSIRFSEVRSIRVQRSRTGNRRNSEMETIWLLESADGTTERQLVFELWMEHYQLIKAQFESRGLVVESGTHRLDAALPQP